MIPTDDLKMLEEANRYLERARRGGVGIVHLPIWVVEALIEKATRSHD